MSDNLTDEAKTKLSLEAFGTFAALFGENDLIKEVFFDILLENIYATESTTTDGNDIPVPRPERQEGIESAGSPGGGEMPTYEIE